MSITFKYDPFWGPKSQLFSRPCARRAEGAQFYVGAPEPPPKLRITAFSSDFTNLRPARPGIALIIGTAADDATNASVFALIAPGPMTALSQLFHDENSAIHPAAIEQAIEQYLERRQDLACWSAFEASPAGQEYPEWVALTYINILRDCAKGDVIPEKLLNHTFEYCKEWFSMDPHEQAYMLIELAHLAPNNRDIFDQCTVTLTHAQMWSELLEIHDRRVETLDGSERRIVLEQAAQIAQDFGQDPKRALQYFASILEIEPTNDRIFSIFVRLVTRENAWAIYAEALAKRAPHLAPQDAQAALLGRAQLLIEKLRDYPTALRQYGEILSEDPACEPALIAIVSVSQDDTLDQEIQCAALEQLFDFYTTQGRHELALAVIDKHIHKVGEQQDAGLEDTRIKLLAQLGRDSTLCARSAGFFFAFCEDPRAQASVRDLMQSHASDMSAALLEVFAEHQETVASNIADALLSASVTLSTHEDKVPSVAKALTRIFTNTELEPRIRERASEIFQALTHEVKQEHEATETLEQQIELATHDSQRVQLLIRLAQRFRQERASEHEFEAWKRILAYAPEHQDAQDHVANHLRGHERWDLLAEHLKQCVQHCEDKERQLSMQLSLVDINLDERNQVDEGIARLKDLLNEFPDVQEVTSRYHDNLLLHDRHQEFVDWLTPRAFARRDVAAIIECAEVYLEKLNNDKDCAQCILEALGIRPEFEPARDLGLALLKKEPDIDPAPVANAIWRSFACGSMQQEMLPSFETISNAYRSPEAQSSLWLEAERNFDRDAGAHPARLYCLEQVLARNPQDPHIFDPWTALVREAPSYGKVAFDKITQTVETNELSPDHKAALYDLAAQLGAQAPEQAVAPSQLVDVQLKAWRTQTNTKRHLDALDGAIQAKNWDAIVELTIGRNSQGAAFDPGFLWSKVCQQTHPAPEDIPLELVEKFAQYYAQDPGKFDHSRVEWVWQLATLLAHHQNYVQARELALPLASQSDQPVDPQRLRTLYAWLRMEPVCEKEALEIADGLYDHLSLNVEERRAHATLDRTLREPGQLRLQLAAWESCERAILNGPKLDEIPAPVLLAMRESLGAYIDISLAQSERAPAVILAKRALKLPLPFDLYEGVFEQCWSHLGYPRESSDQLMVSPTAGEILELLSIDRQRLLDLNVGYQQGSSLWRCDMLAALLHAKKRHFERMEVLAERLERAEAQGPPNTPQQLMQLRLAISSTLRELSRDDGQLDYLMTNLAAVAAHPESLSRAATLLRERGDHERLAKLWSDQATTLMEHHDGDRKTVSARAADLWCQAADCYERQLKDPAKAVHALEQARKLSSRAEILDRLVAFYLADPCLDRSRAASHLHRRLDLASHEERLPMTYRLADLYLQIEQARQSQSVIDEVFEQAAPIVEFRRLYLKAVDSMDEPTQMLAARVRLSGYFSNTELEAATQTATRLLSQLDAHEIDIRELLPLLEQSAPKKPGDMVLQKHFVTALSATGRRDDAVAHLQTLIASHGRRRSPERATLHALLGDQYAMSRALQDAATQFEKAALMDSAQARRWIDVARLYENLGEVESAERALRTLMVHAQKRQLNDVQTPTAAWVMLQLYLLNKKAGNEEVAERHWESCRDRCTREALAAREVLCELAKEGEQQERYLELADRLLDEQLANDFKAEILAQRAEHLEQAGDEASAFQMLLDAISWDPTPASYCAGALRLASLPARAKALDERLDKILSGQDPEHQTPDDETIDRSEKVMVLCCKARLCARDASRYDEIEGYLEQAEALNSRPIELLRTRHDVAYQTGNMEMLRTTLEAMHRQNVLSEPSLGDSWLARAEQYATRSQNYRLALRAIDEALCTGMSRRRALDVLLAFPRFESTQARCAVLDTMQSIAHELCDEQAILRVLEDRLDTQVIDDAQLATLHELALANDHKHSADAALEYALARFEEKPDDAQLWAVWSYIDEHIEAQLASGEEITRMWGLLVLCLKRCEEETLRARITSIIEQEWFPEASQSCIESLETLVEYNASYEPYRTALWNLHLAGNNTDALLDITSRNLALLEEASDRASARIRFVRCTWGNPELSQQRIDMLRTTLSEDPSHSEAQSLLIDHYRENGELDQLEALLQSRLQSARQCQDVHAQAQIGLSLAKINYDRDPVSALSYCRTLFDESTAPLVEVSATCIEWLTAADGREQFAKAFGYQELGVDETWGHYQSFLLERYQTLIEHGNEAQRKFATMDCAKMLGLADRVQDQIDTLLAYRKDHPDCDVTESALIAVYEAGGRHQELVEMLLFVAQQTNDKARIFELTLRCAQITKQDLHETSRAIAILDSLEVEPDSERHYQVLLAKHSYLEDEPAQLQLENLQSGLPDQEELLDFEVEARSPQEFLEVLGHPDLRAKQADLFNELGEHECALSIYRVLAAYEPAKYRSEWVRCQSVLLDALIEGPDKQRAKEAYKTSVRSYLENDELSEEDATSEGSRLCGLGTRLAQRGMRDGDFLQELSNLAIQVENEELEIACQEWSIESQDQDVALQALSSLMELTLQSENYDQARAYLERCHDELREQPEYRSHLKRLYHLQEDYQELAKIEYAAAQQEENDETAVKAYKQAASWFEQAGDADAVRACLEHAALRDANDFGLLVRLIDLDLAHNDTQAASQRLDQALEIIPKDKDNAALIAQLSYKKSQLMGACNDTEAQLEWLQKAHNLNRQDVEIASALASLAEQLEQWELASRALRQLSTLSDQEGAPSVEALCVRQARLWQAANDLRKASFWAHKARHAAPGSDEIRQLLEELAAQQRAAG